MENSESKKERLAYVARVEDIAEGFLNQLENPNEQPQTNVDKLIDRFIKDVDSEKNDAEEADEQIKKLWENLRQKMLNKEEDDDQNVSVTTKRYVRKFLDDIQPQTTQKREKSSKIKLTEEEQQKLKLFGQL